MLKIEELSVGYKLKGKRISVLQNFSLQLEKGRVLAILGPSGCGKSTLIQVLAGMIKADMGEIQIETEGVCKSLDPKTHKIAVIPQNCGLLPWKTVRQNCLLPLKLHKLTIDETINKELDYICRFLSVDALMERYPSELSGGQVRRAALARAFLQTPDLLLMDEPFSSLDAITALDAWKLFLNIWEKKRPTTLLVTHSLQEALYLGHEIVVLDKEDGKILKKLYNPYFAIEEENIDYSKLKHELHELLRPSNREVLS